MPPTNTFKLVGSLAPTGRSGKRFAMLRQTDINGAVDVEFTLNLVTPFGQTYPTTLRTTLGTPGVEFFTHDRINSMFEITGEMQRSTVLDRRYSVNGDDPGLERRETQLLIHRIQPCTDPAAKPMSAVTLEGTITALPSVAYKAIPGVRIASTLLRVAVAGLIEGVAPRMQDINVSTALDHVAVDALCNRKNIVRVTGQLDTALIRATGPVAEQRLAAHDAEWAAGAAQRALRSAAEQREARQRYTFIRSRLERLQCLAVYASQIELISGTPRPVNEAVAEYRERGKNKARTHQQPAQSVSER